MYNQSDLQVQFALDTCDQAMKKGLVKPGKFTVKMGKGPNTSNEFYLTIQCNGRLSVDCELHRLSELACAMSIFFYSAVNDNAEITGWEFTIPYNGLFYTMTIRPR